MSKLILKELKRLKSHLEHYNKMAPFNIYDSDYVKDVNDKIMNVEKDKKTNYDEEPVVACKYCKSLHIVTDEVENNICMRCGSVNELQEFKNIYEYKKFVNAKDVK